MTALDRSIIAIVPAAGIGSRMQADRPKQYLSLLGQSILAHTLQILLDYDGIQQIIVPVAADDPFIQQESIIHHPKIHLVQGGDTRAESVLAGLKHIQDPQAWALVHDAARPCLTSQDLDRLLQVSDEQGAILAIPAIDTIKRSDDGVHIAHTEDRSQLWHALTPQFFPAHLLRGAIEQGLAEGKNITDEASAMEMAGFRPYLVVGRADNLKITRPEDLALAEFYLTRKSL